MKRLTAAIALLLATTAANAQDIVQALIRDHIARITTRPGSWTTVWQFDQEVLAEKRYITRAELDAVAPDRPRKIRSPQAAAHPRKLPH
ncbi:hypothetical protein [Sphingopyxis sp.]|uniref:hypothetical protein n=1 Tax=Sphingopyxis sp. TaxID=1908224 RepID=UPI002FC5DA1C